MGLVRAAVNAVKGGLADSWLEVIEPQPMDDTTCMVHGQVVTQNGKSQNTKGSECVVSNGSLIHVYDNQCMMLIDSGKIVDFTVVPGPYTVNNSSMPSLFCGQFGDSLKETFSRIKFGGIPSGKQYVIFLNLSEMKGIKFGTPTPVQYFDSFYNAELFLRAHGTYSVRITEPLKFYQEVVSKSNITEGKNLTFQSVAQQYNDEFVEALGAAINQYSADGNRVSFIKSKQREIARYMSQTLDEEWDQMRGFQVQSVGCDISYDEKSRSIIDKRSEAGMFTDQAVQQAFVATSIAEGIKNAGSNSNGAMAGFMGLNMGMNAANGLGVFNQYQQNPQYNQYGQQQMQQAPQQQMPQQPPQQQYAQQQPQQNYDQSGAGVGADAWTCTCGAVNTGKFCPECGSKKPEAPRKRFCANCGFEMGPNQKFCPECGTKAE